jgi:CBS-domain-containing membrane protein
MNIGKYMKSNVISILQTATIREAAVLFVTHHIGLLPVVDEQRKLLGVVGISHLLSLELPDFVRFLADVDFVHDFGAVETTRPTSEILNRSITTLMIPALSATEDTGLVRTYVLMLQQELHDMPIVSADGKLVGVASRVDIGVAILSEWAKVA